uniref:cyclin-dependent kinase n=1 Tax=Meloidogyne floridensis TaxID=298350 RepID=A0A915PBV1_9BILA
MTDDSIYNQTDEDTVVLFDESDMIEISPQTVTDENPSERYINVELDDSEEALRQRLIEKRYCKEKPEDSNLFIKMKCKILQRIVWEKNDEDNTTKKMLIKTSTSNSSSSRSVQVIQEEKSAPTLQIQTSQKIEKREKSSSSITRTSDASDLRKTITSNHKQKERQTIDKIEISSKSSKNGNIDPLHKHKERPSSSSNDHSRHHERQQREKKQISSLNRVASDKILSKRDEQNLKATRKPKNSEQKKTTKLEQNEEICSVEKIHIDSVKSPERMEIMEEMNEHEDLSKIKVRSAPSSPGKSKKYSKFESSSESGEDYEIEEDGNKEGEPKGFSFIKLSPERLKQLEEAYQRRLRAQLPVYYPGIFGCRSVVEYECLNKISEGTYGVVYRAQEKKTDEIVALKRLKMEKEHQGFPITSLREINMLLKCGTHPNVLNVREVVVTSNAEKIFLVMEYVEHDLKSLMELMKSRQKKWTIPQVKTLLQQLLSGIEHMHDQYVIHRDLKTSNLLLSHRGILKICDFGLAREFGDPLKPYTPIVVTLWYRSPELLLGCKLYSTPVDMWSIGCIFGELLKMGTLFAGRTEIDQMQKIFKELGTPNEQIWPGCSSLPGMRNLNFPETPFSQLRRNFCSELPDDDGFNLLNRLLALDPSKRFSANEALENNWFKNDPKPAPPSSFPTVRIVIIWPAKSEHNKKPPNEPSAPRKPIAGFTLKFDAPKF